MTPTPPQAGERAEALLPCPFCGGTEHVSKHDDLRNIAVVCNAGDGGCGTRGPYKNSLPRAITAWNTRPAIAALDSEESK